MIKINSKINILLLCGILMSALSAGSVNAQVNVVTGRTYSIYFLSSANSDVDDASPLVHMQVTFNINGSLSVLNKDGDGFYLAGPGAFAATYFIAGLRMGLRVRDVFTSLVGISSDPFIAGAGFFLLDYTEIVPYIFTGVEIIL